MRLALLALLLLAIGLAAVWAAMAWQFSRDVDALSVRVLGPPAAAGVPPHTPQLNGLLSRESAVPDGAVALRLRQRGEMRFGPTERWLPFEAEQLISLTKPAFLWDASVSMLPLIPVRVIDAFDGESGLLDARLGAAFPVSRVAGGDADAGELMRYLAELAWAPGALTRNAALTFEVLSPSHVRVTATAAGAPVTIDLELAPNGDIVAASAAARGMTVGGEVRPTPWGGAYSGWTMIDGLYLPRRAEVSWRPPEGAWVYWRGEILSV
ncbi:MAG TPA: hypothetical protein PK286_10655, partial [Devosia sp.]|nr:hypothetical protein [Devosia sp.]